jgi:caffeoyl-CoA O-methyltransferase
VTHTTSCRPTEAAAVLAAPTLALDEPQKIRSTDVSDPLLPREVDGYLTDLARAQVRDAVLDDMERRADEHGFPIVGRAVGRFLELQARAIGARRVVELGSGYGYSGYFFARAVRAVVGDGGEAGEVVCTDVDPDRARLAESYLRRAGLWDQVRFQVGDALETLATVDGDLDVVFCDLPKDRYPEAWRAAAERLRVGGLFLCDNTLWDGRVAGLPVEPVPSRDAVTADVVAMTRSVLDDERFVTSLVPIRDGVLVALRVG